MTTHKSLCAVDKRQPHTVTKMGTTHLSVVHVDSRKVRFDPPLHVAHRLVVRVKTMHQHHWAIRRSGAGGRCKGWDARGSVGQAGRTCKMRLCVGQGTRTVGANVVFSHSVVADCGYGIDTHTQWQEVKGCRQTRGLGVLLRQA